MELCSHSLQNILQHKPQVFGRQPEEPMNSIEFYISCHIFKEISECVQYLHELNPQIIHRDLKPDNILIARKVRNGRFVKLGDFGLASFHYSSFGSHTTGVGTRQYMAPEVKLQTKYTTKADIYSLAIIAHKLFNFNEFNSPELSIYSGYEIYDKLIKLDQIIDSMCVAIHSTRPECSQIVLFLESPSIVSTVFRTARTYEKWLNTRTSLLSISILFLSDCHSVRIDTSLVMSSIRKIVVNWDLEPNSFADSFMNFGLIFVDQFTQDIRRTLS
ncbi:unnamed protein product [Oppiella nova]|uniref:non-specific serine/threonine protein kinase n=1 Tax=Oppiella nova TaxID=334625 RepID=A0A7R9LQA0_9ACAR|nr:unnamed protein product [Oppiella nova]CAG2165917.1 unnamed protein product [Oppiella nova]